MMMIHNFKGGLQGKGQELVAQLDATVKWFAAVSKKIYVPFLSEDEFERIIRGEDLWMQSPEIRKRLDKMMKILETDKAKHARKLHKAKASAE
jgi:ATP-dependent protease ClpP protease subunit